jgi:hypothetical protein
MRRREEQSKEAKSMPGLDPSVRNAQEGSRAAGTEREGVSWYGAGTLKTY